MKKNKVPSFQNEKIVKVRLGIRLKRFFWPLDLNIIDDMLKKLGYRDIEYTGNQGLDARKSDLHFYLDRSRMVFGFNALNVEKIISAQKDFFSLSDREYHTNLSESVRFYEIEYVSNYYSEKITHDVLKNIYTDSPLISEFQKITQQELVPKGIDLISKNDPTSSDKFFQITIESKVEANNKVYLCRILLRDNSQQNIYEYVKKCSDVIQKSIEKLEK